MTANSGELDWIGDINSDKIEKPNVSDLVVLSQTGKSSYVFVTFVFWSTINFFFRFLGEIIHLKLRTIIANLTICSSFWLLISFRGCDVVTDFWAFKKSENLAIFII